MTQATGGTEAAREDRTPPNPLAIAAYAPPTNTNPATSSPPAARCFPIANPSMVAPCADHSSAKS